MGRRPGIIRLADPGGPKPIPVLGPDPSYGARSSARGGLHGGRIVRGVIPGDGPPRDFIPRLVDLFMAGRMPLDRLITRYDFADINRAAAGAAFRSASVDRNRRPSVAPCRK